MAGRGWGAHVCTNNSTDQIDRVHHGLPRCIGAWPEKAPLMAAILNNLRRWAFGFCLLPRVTLMFSLGAATGGATRSISSPFGRRLDAIGADGDAPLPRYAVDRRPERVPYRHMLGLLSVHLACLHFVTYIWLDQRFDPVANAHGITKRLLITVGFAALVLDSKRQGEASPHVYTVLPGNFVPPIPKTGTGFGCAK
jgi:hypothetical protein